MNFENFSVWRGRLPHWRADNVTYYVTFRHRRPLDPDEKAILYRMLVRPDGQKWDLLILCVIQNQTNLIFRVMDAPNGKPYELSDIVEKAKTRAGKQIVKKSGERFPPFYSESYDRILRNSEELEEYWMEIFGMPASEEDSSDPDDYQFLFVKDAPE